MAARTYLLRIPIRMLMILLLSLAAAGCTESPPADGDQGGDQVAGESPDSPDFQDDPQYTPPTLTVDPGVVPASEFLDHGSGDNQGAGGGAGKDDKARRLASVVDGRGIKGDFIESELLVFTDDPAQLAGVVDRWNGQVIDTLDPKEFNIPKVPAMSVVRIDTSLADPAMRRWSCPASVLPVKLPPTWK